MSSTTTQHPDGRASASVEAAPDEPEFQVRFTLEDPTAPRSQPTNSFHWIGAGRLRIGAHGVTVAGRRRRLMWIPRNEQRFIPSSEIRNVYREADAIRVELREQAARKQFFRFWAGSLKAAATIVALLPTARTVEIDEPSAAVPRFAPAAKPPRSHFWLRAGACLAIAVIALAAVALRYQGLLPGEVRPGTGAAATSADASQDASSSGTDATGREANATRKLSEPQLLRARAEFDRIDARVEGLSTQFGTALDALQTGAVEAENFSTGLETWLIPQWRMLEGELAAGAPAADSAASSVHAALFAAAIHWDHALQGYASGLREHNSAGVENAFAEIRRAENSVSLASYRLQRLEAQTQ